MVEIRRATVADAEEISSLIGDIEEYYGGVNTPGNLSQIREEVFGEHPRATVLLARDGGNVLGMASCSFLWPAAGASASLFLKELFVRKSARGCGIGRALMAAVRSVAEDEGCSRVEWHADADNPAALGFYEALGVQPDRGKIFYRVGK